MAAASSAATAMTVTTEQTIFEWWVVHSEDVFAKMLASSPAASKLHMRFYGGWALNMLAGHMFLKHGETVRANPTPLQVYREGVKQTYFPASDMDAKIYGVPVDQEYIAAESLLYGMADSSIPLPSFEEQAESVRSWVIRATPLRNGMKVMPILAPRTGPVSLVLGGIVMYYANGNVHAQIQLAAVARSTGRLQDLAQLSFVQEPLEGDPATRIGFLSLRALKQQFELLRAVIIDRPELSDKLAKTDQRIRMCDHLLKFQAALEEVALSRGAYVTLPPGVAAYMPRGGRRRSRSNRRSRRRRA